MSHRVCTFHMVAVTSLVFLTSCGGKSGNGTAYSYHNITISVSPQVTSVPVGTSTVFTSTVTNAPNTPIWYVAGPDGPAAAGTLTNITPSTAQYTAPATPPISAAIGTPSETQGTVTLFADFAAFDLSQSTRQTFAITASSITVGIHPVNPNVALNGTQQFTGYAVGNINNAVIWTVNGIVGGSPIIGTITTRGLYTAPSSVPLTGDTVTVTVTSQADRSKSESSVITLR